MEIQTTKQAFIEIESINQLVESKRTQEKLVRKYDNLKEAAKADADYAEDNALDKIKELTDYIQKCERAEVEGILAAIFHIY